MGRFLVLLASIPVVFCLTKPSDEVVVVAEVTRNPQMVEASCEDILHEWAEDVIVMETSAEQIAEEDFVEQFETADPEETVAEELPEIETVAEETLAEETFEEDFFVEETMAIEEIQEQEETTEPTEGSVSDNYANWHTGELTARKGYITDGPAGPNGNDGYETWYDLEMAGVVRIMRKLGYSEEDYPYWVREDGCKMFGPYIMVAGDIVNTHNRGDIIEISLGTAMLCDYCEMAVKGQNHYWIDVATDWAHTYSIRK